MNDLLRANITAGERTSWDRAANLEHDKREMQPVTKIVVKGSVEVVFFRSSGPQALLIVAGKDEECIRRIKTCFTGSDLSIEQEGVSYVTGGGSIRISGSENIVAGSNYFGGGRHSTTGADRCLVGVALPQAPKFRVKGSAEVSLYDLKQPAFDVKVRGSGSLTATGQVDHLSADVAGSGDVDAQQLLVHSATLSVSGSGDIKVNVSHAVRAHVKGSGDIVVRGNPTIRDHKVEGSGDIQFKK